MFKVNQVALSKRLAVSVGMFALVAGMAPMGDALAQQAPDGPSIIMTDVNGTTVESSASALMTRANQAGEVRIIVGRDTRFVPEGGLSASAATSQRAGIAAAQAQMAGALSNAKNMREFDTIPFMAMTVSPDDLARMMTMPGVTSIQEDVPVPPTMDDTVLLTEASSLWKKRHRGSGAVVAVLDTGTRYQHHAFNRSGSSKIIGSACFSSNTGISSSVCPNGQEEMVSNTDGTAGPNCDNSVSGCDHGTHVAAIAAGSQRGNHGMAHHSDILSVQVFSRFDGSTYCGSSSACVLSYTSDQIAGLEQVLTWVNSGVNVASVNMSLGGGRHYSHCDFDSRKAIIDNLKAAGVATVIASGNNGYGDSVGAPSCISTAVTVGSTTKSDSMSSFSNHDQIVDVLAPGSSIRAASAGGARNALTFKSGTSMATPHVAGAFALLKAAVPGSTPDEIERALKCTGRQIVDNNTPKPRVSMKLAYDFLKKPHTRRSFPFKTAKQVDSWTHVLGNWTFGIKDMRVVADQNARWYVSLAPFCANDISVTADVTRTDPDTGNDWDSGLLLNSTVSSDGKISGLAFLYRVSASNVTTGAIVQIDALNGVTNSGSTSVLCERDFNGKALGETRELSAEKQGNTVEFKIDGITVCSAQTDARFTDGHAGVIWEAPDNDPSHTLIADKVKLDALTQSSTVTGASFAGN